MTQESLKGLTADELFALLSKATKELSLLIKKLRTNKELEKAIQDIKRNVLLLRRVMIAKRGENLNG
jgi:hypothetical protein